MKNGLDLHLIFKLLFFLEFTALANGRGTALLSPFSPPAPSPHFPSISSPPHAMQVVVIYNHSHIQKELVLTIVLSSVAITLIMLSASFIWIFCLSNRTRTNSKHNHGSDSSGEVIFGPNSGKFSSFKATGRKNSLAVIEYSVLESATNNFNESNIIGQGGFGFVYKACFGEGVFAAVKKLDGSSQYCESEFENEVDLLGKIHHPNIITLLGYCVHEDMRFLVYELMHNGSLESQLYGPSAGSALTWHMRMKIALDVARGLEHLHENCSPTVIHRDLKSSNILLDSEFKAKISDFGLAVSRCNETKSEIKLSGTLGYVAPEYLLDGKLTEKSDVYAFGVVLLELLTGRKPVEKLSPTQCQTIVSWAIPQLTDRAKLPTLVDPAIKNTMDLKHLYQVAAVAVLCVQPEPSYRPLITDVLHSLVPLVPSELGGTLRISDYGKPNINLQQKL